MPSMGDISNSTSYISNHLKYEEQKKIKISPIEICALVGMPADNR